MNWILQHPVETFGISALTIFGLLFGTALFLTFWRTREAGRQDAERQRLERIMRASERPYPRAAGSPSKRVS